jgi:hypothetical protein
VSGFLSRWSRRKAEALREAPTPDPGTPPDGAPEEAALPPLESLSAASDFSVFLRQGIAPALQSQALRVAWESDATIATFRGMAEYDWDFNAEGYGRLGAFDNVAAMLKRLIPMALPPEAPTDETTVQAASPPTTPDIRTTAPAPIAAPEELRAEVGVADDPEPEITAPPVVRRHGGALPS